MNTGINLILPNTKKGVVLNLNLWERIYFLAGPIKGGGDWQARAIKLLHEQDPHCYIACPCRYGPEHELFQYQIEPTKILGKKDDYALSFETQVLWERYYLEYASQYGSIIFWLPCEDTVNPRKDGAYARDTSGELGRWSIRSARPSGFPNQHIPTSNYVNLTIGAEEGFPGLGVIRKNLDADHGKLFMVYQTLESTIEEAIRKGKEIHK